MTRSLRRWLGLALAVMILVIGALVWVEAVERWIGQQLRAQAEQHLNPHFDFDDLDYRFPRTIALRGARLTSPDPDTHGASIDILSLGSLTLVLAEIPRPNQPFRMHRLELGTPTLRFVATGSEETGELLGYSDLLKQQSDPSAQPAEPTSKRSDILQVREVSITNAGLEYDPRGPSPALTLIDGISAELRLHPDDAGRYAIDLSVDHQPVSGLRLRGKLHVDDERLEDLELTANLDFGREQDHYFTPAVQKFLAEHDIAGKLTLNVTGALDFDDAESSHSSVRLELSDAGYAAGEYILELERVDAQIETKGKSVSVENVAIDALGGHAKLTGSLDLDEAMSGVFQFEGSDLQISDLLRGPADAKGLPLFSGLLDFSGDLRGPFSEIERHAQGQGRLTLRKARLGRIPVLATIDEALDATAETLMKKEHKGHASLSLQFSFHDDLTRLAKLRMNDRWYGLRGHGDVYFDSRLDLAVDGGPVQRLENELGKLGDVLGEITESIVRARVTGTLADPDVGIEILRHGLK